jgi:hypothetical protein
MIRDRSEIVFRVVKVRFNDFVEIIRDSVDQDFTLWMETGDLEYGHGDEWLGFISFLASHTGDWVDVDRATGGRKG